MVIGAEVAKKAATAGPEAGKQIGDQAEAATDGANQNTGNTNTSGNGESGGSGPGAQAPPRSTPQPNLPTGPKPDDGPSKPPTGGKE